MLNRGLFLINQVITITVSCKQPQADPRFHPTETKCSDQSANQNYFRFARELQLVLDYKEWRKFENVIKKLKTHVKTAVLVRLNILLAPTSCRNVLQMQELETLINSIILDIKDYTNKEILNKK